MSRSSAVRLVERSNIAEARGAARQHAEWLGWRDADRGDCEIVASELATNLIKHARDGVMAVSSLLDGEEGEVLLVAVDQGPGMADVERCLSDGYSTAGSPGTGLGAVLRLSQHADVASSPRGTVVIAALRRPAAGERVPASNGAALPAGLRLAGFALPKEGEPVNGDGWAYRVDGSRLALLVCDGLGHGDLAHAATRRAIETFLDEAWQSPKETLAAVDRALRATRGAAGAIAVIDTELGSLRFCGVGNIAAGIVTDEHVRHLVSQNGILGSAAPRLTEFDYAWTHDATLVMHSDGVHSRWQGAQWAGLWQRHPALTAGLLYRDCARGTDDVVVVAVRR